MFTLCKTYAETQNKNKCIHNNSERSFIGTWTTDEVNKAIDKGYKILKVYETWHFDKTSDNLFKGYIRRFIKIKHGASLQKGRTRPLLALCWLPNGSV